MNIIIGADHRGASAARRAAAIVREMGHDCRELLPPDENPVDYPDYARQVGEAVAGGQFDCGVLVCHTGIGMSIAANKVRGVRAALCSDAYEADISRRHNHSNVLCLGERNTDRDALAAILNAWFGASPEGGRHARRVAKIEEIPR